MPSIEYEAFLEAIADNNVANCQRIIESSRGEILREKDEEERNILHHAVLQDKIDITRLLISEDKKLLNEADLEGKTPLYIGAEQGKEDQVRTLLLAGADPNIYGINRDTNEPPSHILLAPIINKDLRIPQMLVDRGAEVSGANERGETPLHLSVIYDNPNLTFSILEKNPTIINAKDEDGNTAAHLAGMFNDKDTFLLAEAGADLSIKNNSGMNPVHLAASRKQGISALASFLTSRPDLIDSQDSQGRTPIYLATLRGNVQAKEMLLEEGANPDIPDNKGKTARQLERENTIAVDSLSDRFLKGFAADPSTPSRVRAGSGDSLASTASDYSPRGRAGSETSSPLSTGSPGLDLVDRFRYSTPSSPTRRSPTSTPSTGKTDGSGKGATPRSPG